MRWPGFMWAVAGVALAAVIAATAIAWWIAAATGLL
jgi:hypothetical protein